MVRFLHTSDWHMGLSSVQLGEKASEARKIRFQTASRIADIARSEKVEFVILAGDTFDSNNVDDFVVRSTIDLLNRFAPIPVLMLPGNHDPLTAASVWDRSLWKHAGSHINLLVEQAETRVTEDTFVYPCPVSQKLTSKDPTSWIPERRDDDIVRIGIAHGALSNVPGALNFPIPVEREKISGLDYLALGDWHSFHITGKTVYSGTHEQTKFGESEAGNVLIVDIEEPSSTPIIDKRHVGMLDWKEYSVHVIDETDVQTLRSKILSSSSLSSEILRLAVTFDRDLSDEALRSLVSLRSELVENAFYVDWPEESLQIPTGQVTPLPPGMLTDIQTILLSLYDGRRWKISKSFSDVDKMIVQEALTLLRRLSTEGTN
ncbi:MAG: DNA repair exonuclease [Candidatus Thermoplasmatota archaeon]|nr:DNA repair exonuclease [Candidatus Thermoplasmatota archaeon]